MNKNMSNFVIINESGYESSYKLCGVPFSTNELIQLMIDLGHHLGVYNSAFESSISVAEYPFITYKYVIIYDNYSGKFHLTQIRRHNDINRESYYVLPLEFTGHELRDLFTEIKEVLQLSFENE